MTNADNGGTITIRSQLFRKTLEVIEEEEDLENTEADANNDNDERESEYLEDEIDGGLADGGLYFFESSQYFNNKLAKWNAGWDWDTGTFNSPDINVDQIWKLRKDEESGAWFIFNHRFKDHRLAMWGKGVRPIRESGTRGDPHGLSESHMWKLEQQEDGLYTIENVAYPGHFWIKWGPDDSNTGAAYIGEGADWAFCLTEDHRCRNCDQEGCHKWHLQSIFDGLAVEWREIFSYNNTGQGETKVEVSFLYGVTSEYEFGSTSEMSATLAGAMQERTKEKDLQESLNYKKKAVDIFNNADHKVAKAQEFLKHPVKRDYFKPDPKTDESCKLNSPRCHQKKTTVSWSPRYEVKYKKSNSETNELRSTFNITVPANEIVRLVQPVFTFSHNEHMTTISPKYYRYYDEDNIVSGIEQDAFEDYLRQGIHGLDRDGLETVIYTNITDFVMGDVDLHQHRFRPGPMISDKDMVRYTRLKVACLNSI